MYQSERERVECILAEDVAALERRDIHAQGAIRVGEPAHQIARFAAGIRADLVVVGYHRRGVLSRCWQGSVGASLLDRLGCSVLVAQAPDESPEPSDTASRARSSAGIGLPVVAGIAKGEEPIIE